MQRTLTYAEWRSERKAKEQTWDEREDVRTAIDAGIAATMREPPDEQLLERAVERLAELLVGSDGRLIDYYSREITHNDQYPLAALRAVATGQPRVRDYELALDALIAIADHEGITEDVSNHAEARGFELPMGRVWSSYEMEYGDEIRIVSRNSGWPKTLFCGDTGQGKSATLDGAVADRYASGMKIVDLVDTDEFESGVYDIPQRQPALRDARRDLELPAGADVMDDFDAPDLEILVPLTPETASMDVPVPEGADVDDSVVRPFTIPASDLDETTLVSFLTALVSKQQEASIRTAYNAVAEGDWTLQDLAEQIAKRDDLQDSYQRRVLRLLEDLQSKGFIRDQDCEYAIDWDDIFYDTDTVTAFSVAPLEEIDQLMVLSYLVRALYDERTSRTELPACAGVARELHEIVPHREEAAADARAEALQGAIASNLSYILRKNRHERLEILADTQDVMDLKKGVRLRFSRFVAFQMPDRSLKSCFEYAGASGFDSCRNSIGPEAGVGAVIGMSEAAIEYERDFISPVQFAPAPFHHFDVDEHDSGFDARCDYLDEDLVPVPWLGSVPDRLCFGVGDVAGEEIAEGSPYQEFAEECLERGPGKTVVKRDVIDAYNNFAEERGYDTVGVRWFLRKFRKQTTDEWELESYSERKYDGVELTQAGQQYLPSGGADTEMASGD
ncbi:hypothetical protein AArcSl_1657 [Halalkaliarchaeum desulfuricum]|uniref:Uncharacterized protein n=1 Tax=Halalkaliarchaeum desulfuricum TaxID=2055893 RepID=A0A343TJL4_9EURY|nr:hypothetical protein [Halalkaliarchaeum desulfuricum]AUX09286.1 hypothetical protein AArcSl_1657 [Halalkaliarchaeum desulfuricum]